jgi:hypothetical protein
VNQARRSYPELESITARFTLRTRSRLTRALVYALRRRSNDFRAPLHAAVLQASAELQAEGLNDGAILEFFSRLVEDAGRACGADRPSLMSGELQRVPVRDRVLGFVRTALDVPTLS